MTPDSNVIDSIELLAHLAGVKTLSIRMKTSGRTLSNKVAKKWRSRCRTKIPTGCKHNWWPMYMVSPKVRLEIRSYLYWQCTRCRTSTSVIKLSDVPESFRIEPHLQHVRRNA